jgi:hypothetical protein
MFVFWRRAQILFLLFPFFLEILVFASLEVTGDSNLHNIISGSYMVEFSGLISDGRKIILHHFVQMHGYNEKVIIFRTSTKTDLFHGHSFHISGSFDENHVLNIPEAIRIHRVIGI